MPGSCLSCVQLKTLMNIWVTVNVYTSATDIITCKIIHGGRFLDLSRSIHSCACDNDRRE